MNPFTVGQTFGGTVVANKLVVAEHGGYMVKLTMVGRGGRAITLRPKGLRHHIDLCEQALTRINERKVGITG